MKKSTPEEVGIKKVETKTVKILFLFFIVAIGFLIFILTLLYWAQIDRRLPRLQRVEKNSALRGSIISNDGFTVSSSKKLYKSIVDTRNIDPNKKELFIKLYSLYSNSSPKKIKRIINSHLGHVILSYKIDAKTAKHLKKLARKLYRLGVFITYEDKKTGITFVHGLDIIESGEYRDYPNKDTLAPIAGYVRKIEKDGITKVEGVKGLESFYNEDLNPIQNALVAGKKDIAGTIILNRESKNINRIDGYNIHLHISLKLQKIIENILDIYQQDLRSDEIIAAVMDSKTGNILSLASSNRFTPNAIKRKDYPNLNISAVEYTYEPGSVMKSIAFALLLQAKKINPYDLVKTYGGRYKLGRKVIVDAHAFDWLSAEDVIVHSSNIGIAQLAQKLNNIEFHEGLKDFGFSRKSGIDIPYEHTGVLPSIRKFKSEIYKATVGYGYGMTATFMQILKAYNVFNNNGRILTPRTTAYLSNQLNKTYKIAPSKEKQVIPVSVAKRMHSILIKAVNKGTGDDAITEGLEIGGKTGTAHIAQKGSYANLYNSSFFGFANDKTSKYTIGVLVVKPRKYRHYFASQSAVPVFKEIVDELIEQDYLKPEI